MHKPSLEDLDKTLEVQSEAPENFQRKPSASQRNLPIQKNYAFQLVKNLHMWKHEQWHHFLDKYRQERCKDWKGFFKHVRWSRAYKNGDSSKSV